MEEFGGSLIDGINNAVRKKRSQASRRPRPDSQSFVESRDSMPPSDDDGRVSSYENPGYDYKPKRKEFDLNQYVSGFSSSYRTEGEKLQKRSKKDEGGFNIFYNNEPGRCGYNNKQSSEGVLAPVNWRRNGESQSSGQLGVNFDGPGNESKVKKVKLKVGGVMRTIHANSTANGATKAGSVKGSLSPDDSRLRQKQNLQGNSDSSVDKRGGLQGIPWKDFSRGGFGFGKEDSLMGKSSGKNPTVKQGERSGSARKSKRVPKKLELDGEFEDEEDDEIRYLEKLKTSKVIARYKEDDEESGKKQQKLSRVSILENVGTSRSGKDGKKKSRSDKVSEMSRPDKVYEMSRPDKVSEDFDYAEEEELVSDGEVGGNGKMQKKQKKESIDSLMDYKREMPLTTRQRALQSSKDASTAPSSIDYPNGLPPAPPRKQKEKLTEVEQQLKKAEAAQRRRMQVEKANRESEEQAIRKILGQDSKREKRKVQIKKRQEELAQEKAALRLESNTIRWVSGPTGTVVTFPKEMGFPSIFDSKPCSYPPPRENCAGPSCTNPYVYRDSKSKLPLCSLHCYKAIQEKTAV